MTKSLAYRLKHMEESGAYVRLNGKAIAGLNRLKDAYGMPKRESVLAYLIEQGVKGLEAAEGGGSSDE